MIPDVPLSLRTCRGIPPAPKEPYTQKDVARFATTMAGALKDCRNKLRGVDSILTQHDALKKAMPSQ